MRGFCFVFQVLQTHRDRTVMFYSRRMAWARVEWTRSLATVCNHVWKDFWRSSSPFRLFSLI
jgi:hypothetical protein